MSKTQLKTKQIFMEALEQSSLEGRRAYVDSICGHDSQLRGKIEELLLAYENAGNFLGGTPIDELDDVHLDQYLIADQIGPYKLLEQIGEGGMGTVWLAEQQHPVRRRVALKLIKPGMDTKQVLARFEAERHALSMMDHPNIAKVLDAGTLETGGRRPEAGGRRQEAGGSEAGDRRPEARGGEAIEDKNLPQETSPARQSEELLSEVDYSATDLPPPASRLQPPASSLRSPASGLQPIGRPYFVMELVKGQPITEYCDQHQLTPKERLELFLPVCHAIQHAHQKGIIHRDIKPSNVLVAEYDGRPVAKVIDFGVAKAIHQPLTEKTMFTGLGQIIGTLEYMSPEQARVNQLDVDTRSDIYSLGVLLYELLTGSTPLDRKRLREAALDEMLRIIREEEPPRPSTKLRSSQTLPSIAARRNTEPTRLSTLVRGELDWIVMKSLEKNRDRRYETADGFAQDIQRYLAGEVVQACPPSASYRIGKFARRNKAILATSALVAVALTLGLIATTWQAVRATHAERLAISERDQKELARIEAADSASQARLAAEAENVAREGEAVQRRMAEDALAKAQQESEVTEAVNQFLLNDLLALADSRAQIELGLPPNPEVRLKDLLNRGAKVIEERFADKPTIREPIRAMIAKAYSAVGSYPEAFEQWQKVWESTIEQFDPHDPQTISVMNSMALAAEDAEKLDTAEELYESAWQQASENLGPEHLESLIAIHNLAAFYRTQGRTSEAEPLFQVGLSMHEELLGQEHKQTLLFRNSLGMFYLQTDRLAQAQTLYQDIIPRMQRVLGNEHPFTLVAMNNLAGCSNALMQLDEETLWLERVLPGMQKVLGDEHPYTVLVMRNLAGAYWRGPNGAPRALPLFQRVANCQRIQLKSELISSSELATTLYALTACLIDQEEWLEAEVHAREADELFSESDRNNYRRYLTLSMLGEALYRRGQLEEARRCLQMGYEGLRQLRHEIPSQSRHRAKKALDWLIHVLKESGESERLAQWQAEADLWEWETVPQMEPLSSE